MGEFILNDSKCRFIAVCPFLVFENYGTRREESQGVFAKELLCCREQIHYAIGKEEYHRQDNDGQDDEDKLKEPS